MGKSGVMIALPRLCAPLLPVVHQSVCALLVGRQDTVATIKRQLQLLVPEMEIFLVLALGKSNRLCDGLNHPRSPHHF